MAQLVLMTETRPQSRGVYQAGEVIAVFDDSHEFSANELAKRCWRIIRIAGLPKSALGFLLEGHQTARRCQRFAAPNLLPAMRGQGIIDLSPAAASALFGQFGARS